MALFDFSNSELTLSDFGGKANTLAQLTRIGFPVPAALALSAPPDDANEWDAIVSWWDARNRAPLAVRSSACGEDGADLSFAGQHETLLNVDSLDALRDAINTCFGSTDTEHARTYRNKMGIGDDAIRMNVLLQLMVQPRYAGVYFSRDPRGQSGGWLIEYVEGLGEDLVSGRVTPSRITETDVTPNAESEFTAVLKWGRKAAASLDYDLDMEWAIDGQGQFHLLQCRPITTDASTGSDALAQALTDLRQRFAEGTLWDGQPFAEWPGEASPAGYSLWAKAFSQGHAFDHAIRRLGYRGCPKGVILLDRVLGRPFVNLERLMPCFYGPLPCRMVADPDPRLTFNAGAIGLASLLNLPGALLSMLRVAGRMSSSRTAMLKECRSALTDYQERLDEMAPIAEGAAADVHIQELRIEYAHLTRDDFTWPLALIMLVQSTTKTIEAHLAKSEFRDTVAAKLQEWMSTGLQTATLKMLKAQQSASEAPDNQAAFLSQYGHRGPGELDIANRRWVEIGNAIFSSGPSRSPDSAPPAQVDDASGGSGIVARQIDAMTSFRKTLIAQEWELLRDMLVLREEWKMSLMRAFFTIRKRMLALGAASGLGDDIFLLSIDEVLENGPANLNARDIDGLLATRKQEQAVFSGISLPEVLSLDALDDILSGESGSGAPVQQGVALSPGLAEGEVRVVMGDPSAVDLSSWPDDVILVTESTDPGWTPLFARVRGIVVEKGGVLSHCAIVAREMHIPAVSQIVNCQGHFKDGDRIWVDGMNGTVRTQVNE